MSLFAKLWPSRKRNLHDLDGEELNALRRQDMYGDLRLTDAVRPPPGTALHEGFKFDADPRDENARPIVVAAATREKLLDVLMELIADTGDWLEVCHSKVGIGKAGNYARSSDHENMIVRSALWEFEEMLLHDGDLRISFSAKDANRIVHLDDHKLVHITGTHKRVLAILKNNGMQIRSDIRMVHEGEHRHFSDRKHMSQFEALSSRFPGEA